jgi:hypothetical protein
LDVDRFGEKWVFVDAETSVRLGSRDERCEKNDWRVLQLRILADLCRNFASVSVGHDYIKEDQIRPKIPGSLVGSGRIVFFEDQIAPCLFEKNFDQFGRAPIVVDNQKPTQRKIANCIQPGESDIRFPGKEVYFDDLAQTFIMALLVGQPGDKPGAKESKYDSDQRAGDGEPKRNSLAQRKRISSSDMPGT